MRGETGMVTVLEYRPRGYDSLDDHLVYGMPQPVQIDALRQQDLVQSRYLADQWKFIDVLERFSVNMVISG